MISTQKGEELLLKIIEGLIDNPRELEIDSTVLPGRINIRARVVMEDAGKIIGTGGSHVKALKAIAAVMGRRYGQEWRFIVLDPRPGPERATPTPIAPVASYNCAKALEFLHEICDALLDERPSITVHEQKQGDECVFAFTIAARSVQDYELLAAPVMTIPEQKSLVESLGTIWRAYGRQQGVRFKIEIPSR